MKDKPIVVIITLTAGLVACICCILKEAGLLATLIAVFASLLIFLVIGMIVNSIIAKQRHIAEEREKDLTIRSHEAVCRLAGIDPKKNIYKPVFDHSKRIDYYTDTYGVKYKGSH